MNKNTKKNPGARIAEWGGKAKAITSILVAATVLAGCQGTILKGRANVLEGQGHSPQWIEGYKDGCNSGWSAGGDPWVSFKKDSIRYANEVEYKNGWNVGYSNCLAEQNRIKYGR